MNKRLIHRLVGLVSSSAFIGGNLAEGARLLAEGTGYGACSIYSLSPGGQRFILKAHFGTDPKLSAAAQVDRSSWLVEKLGFGALVTVDPSELFAGARTKSAVPYSIYPLGSKESLKGFLLLRGAPATTGPESEALLSVAASVIFMAIKCEEMTVQNEALNSKAIEAGERLKGIEKFLYLGDMAAMLAHEIKNPIVSIGGFAARLKRSIEPESKANRYMEQMIAEIQRIEKITDAAFRFMEDEYMELEQEDLCVLLYERVELFADDYKRYGITVSTNIDSKPLLVMADREQLKIAFDNLIANAVQSMADGGNLTVSAQWDDSDIVVDITDSGGGIEEASIGSIFTPFFTTKKSGTGLGLPISHSIIRRHKGDIEVLSNSGIGTTFRVRLKGCNA